MEMTDEQNDIKPIDGELADNGEFKLSDKGKKLLAMATVKDAEDASHRQLCGMYQSWFLEYASYVILERAVPHIDDGLKPVQRRILHSMKTLDDGRFNKVANIVGNTMQYHPHGDASIYEPFFCLGQN